MFLPALRHMSHGILFFMLIIEQIYCTRSLIISELARKFRSIYRRNGFPFREHSEFGNKPIWESYDFVIVGSGPAGSVVANRLSENQNWNVLLLEAGEDESPVNQITPIAHYLQFTNFNWNYLTEPQSKACLGLNRGRCPWPAGKGTGGASLINNNIYTRGDAKDYDSWAKAGNSGWSYREVLPYFLKSEDVNIGPLKRSEYHGVNGPLPVEYPPFRSKLLDAFLESAGEVNTNIVDYNNPHTHFGFSHIQGTIRFGRKISAYKSFLRPYRNRTNLHIAIRSRVTKILIDPESKAAYGVEFVKKNIVRRVFAKKEVIISAGAFNSPQLLMLSGIGPTEHLQSLRIPTLQDLRVGDNLQEHPAYANLAFLVNQTVGLVVQRLIDNVVEHAVGWFEGQGWLTTLGCEGLGYVSTKYNDVATDPPPDIEYIFVPTSLAGEGGLRSSILRQTMAIPDSTFQQVYADIVNKDAWSIWVMLMYPESRGTVRLRSSNPWHPPIMQSNFFDREIDLQRIVEGIKMVLQLSETKSFQKYGSTLHRKPIPGCKQLEFGSDNYWRCCVQQLTMQMHHQSGTCKMGPQWDRNAVVSPQLKVYGMNNLRVIDSSIMPTIPGGHTVAAAYMIGEKGADLIKQDWA